MGAITSSMLYNAAVIGDAHRVAEMLTGRGIDVNHVFGDGDFTPLYAAAQKGHTEVVRLLLGVPGIDVNKATKTGWTPLTEASELGHTEIVRLLLGKPGIDVNKATNGGLSPLERATARCHEEIVRLLLGKPGIDVNKATMGGVTPLLNAIWGGSESIIKLLLAAPGIDVNKASTFGSTPLATAATMGQVDTVKALLAFPHIHVPPSVVSKAQLGIHESNAVNVAILSKVGMTSLVEELQLDIPPHDYIPPQHLILLAGGFHLSASAGAASASSRSASAAATSVASPLPSYVASQMLELEILKHSTCPITYEPLTKGSASVMSCGHVFSRAALTSALAVTPGKCPNCRSVGVRCDV